MGSTRLPQVEYGLLMPDGSVIARSPTFTQVKQERANRRALNMSDGLYVARLNGRSWVPVYELEVIDRLRP